MCPDNQGRKPSSAGNSARNSRANSSCSWPNAGVWWEPGVVAAVLHDARATAAIRSSGSDVSREACARTRHRRLTTRQPVGHRRAGQKVRIADKPATMGEVVHVARGLRESAVGQSGLLRLHDREGKGLSTAVASGKRHPPALQLAERPAGSSNRRSRRASGAVREPGADTVRSIGAGQIIRLCANTTQSVCVASSRQPSCVEF